MEVQQLLEEHGDGARVPFGEGVNLPDARDEVGHRGDVGGVVAVLRGRGAELREGGFQIVLEGGVVPVGHRLPCEDELALRDVVVAVVLLVEGLFHKAAEEATVDGAQGGGGEGEPVGVQSVADAGAHEVGLLGVAVDAALDLLVVVVVYDVAQLAGADVAGHVALGRLVEGGAGGEPVDGLQAPGSAHASVAHLVGVGLFVALVFRSRAHGPPSC